MIRTRNVVTLWLVVLIVAACATADVIPMGTDSYMISQTSAGGVFKSMGALKADVMRRATAFAESKGKVAIPIASKESPAYPGHMPNFEYQFRLVDRDDPRAAGGGLAPRADVVIQNQNAPSPAGNVKDKAASQDVYTELLKLDDLRKKGLLTEAEFEVQKQKLLSAK